MFLWDTRNHEKLPDDRQLAQPWGVSWGPQLILTLWAAFIEALPHVLLRLPKPCKTRRYKGGQSIAQPHDGLNRTPTLCYENDALLSSIRNRLV